MEYLPSIFIDWVHQPKVSSCATLFFYPANGALSAAELELMVLARLELAAIHQQRHLSATSAEAVMSAMEELQQSEIFADIDMEEQMSPQRYLLDFLYSVPGMFLFLKFPVLFKIKFP